MHSSFRLLAKRRFLPLFATQFLGAFNDNLFKTAMVMLVTYHIYADERKEMVFNAVAAGCSFSRSFCFPPLPASSPTVATSRRSCGW